MVKTFIAAASASFVLMSGAAFAGECTLGAEAPAMPDPATATEEDRNATIDSIVAYQGALAEYRTCLEAIENNTELEVEVRQAARDKYNVSVDKETQLVENWVAFDAAWQEANG
jgi:hypothetical protein